jgi:hypothetical protein
MSAYFKYVIFLVFPTERYSDIVPQRIPKPPAQKSSKAGSQSQALESEKVHRDAYAATAHSLQPLLEQEALLEYVHPPHPSISIWDN